MLFYVGTYTGAGVFLPLYLVQVRGESTTQAGVVLGIGGFMWTVGSIFASSRTGRWPVRLAVIGAVLIAIASALAAAQAAIGNLPLALIYVSWGAAGFGVGLAILHLSNWVLVYSPPAQTGAVSAAVQTMRMLGSAAGAALMGAVLVEAANGPVDKVARRSFDLAFASTLEWTSALVAVGAVIAWAARGQAPRAAVAAFLHHVHPLPRRHLSSG